MYFSNARNKMLPRLVSYEQHSAQKNHGRLFCNLLHFTRISQNHSANPSSENKENHNCEGGLDTRSYLAEILMILLPRVVFSALFSVLDIPVKHCLSCSTYYFLSFSPRLPSSGLKTKISSSAWLHTLVRATWNSTCRRASKLKQRVIHVKSKLKGPFTRVRTKTCAVPPCVYTGPAELDEFLNGSV